MRRVEERKEGEMDEREGGKTEEEMVEREKRGELEG